MPGTEARSDSSEALADLSGDWEGCYMQSGAARKITAAIAQTGDRITGTMRPPGADEQIDESLRRLHPAERKAPICSKSRLPSDSKLEGTVRGGFVAFTKIYQGQHFSGYQIGSQEVGWSGEGHAVRYSGRIEADGNRIEGVWTISDADSPQRAVQGPFWLERVAGRV